MPSHALPSQVTAKAVTETVVTVTVNGTPITVPSWATVAAAVVLAGQACRTSVGGEPRGPLCGMGICYECRVAIDGIPHSRSCQVLCKQGMEVNTEKSNP